MTDRATPANVADVIFYVGLHQPSDARHFARSCISINRVRGRKKPVLCADVLLDSGAFTELEQHGCYRHSVAEYADEVRRLHERGIVQISAAVAQDYMCESFMLKKTGLSLEDHQRLTIQRYDEFMAENPPVPVMPVLQGFSPGDYVKHVIDYGDRLNKGAWVGVGSVCKRQGNPREILRVLTAIRNQRPDIMLHGFGVKTTALLHPGVRDALYTADSMAWSFAARKEGRNPNDWREAMRFSSRIDAIQTPQNYQLELGI